MSDRKNIMDLEDEAVKYVLIVWQVVRDLKRRVVRMQQYFAYTEILGEDVILSALPDPCEYPTKRKWESAMQSARVELRKLALAEGMVAPGLFEQTWQ